MFRLSAVCALALSSCAPTQGQGQDLSWEFKDYWYDNTGEISSYELKIARYGEIREGSAVMVFVTEAHSPSLGTKPDNYKKDQVPVLKLNTTMKFHTGVYPYSIMTSTFLPVESPEHSLKITSSSQEWCGHTFMEMSNGRKMKVKVSSYFEGESKEATMDKALLEDDLFSLLRINPEALPVGDLQMIPAFYDIRLSHIGLQPYAAKASKETASGMTTYTVHYPALERTLSITYENAFPHKIAGWEKEGFSGFGPGRKKMTTTATLINTIKSTYWSKNHNSDQDLRAQLGLD